MTFLLRDAFALAVASTLVPPLGECVLCATGLHPASNVQTAMAVSRIIDPPNIACGRLQGCYPLGIDYVATVA